MSQNFDVVVIGAGPGGFGFFSSLLRRMQKPNVLYFPTAWFVTERLRCFCFVKRRALAVRKKFSVPFRSLATSLRPCST
jgi:hypothetical protein